MQQGDQQIGVLKVFKTKNKIYKPGNHDLPIILMVRFKKGANPQYTTYKAMRKQHPDLLLDYFQSKINFRDQTAPLRHTQNQFTNDPFNDLGDNYREPEKQSPAKQIKPLRNPKLRKNSPKKENNKDVTLTTDSRPVRSCRFKNQYSKEHPRELRGYHHQKQEHQISQSYNESEKQITEKNNQRTQPQLKKILDYDYLIQESYCLNLISPAVIPPIKQKHESIMHPPIPYQLPPRINFKQFEQQPFSSQEYKDEDQSQYLIDERGKEKRRREKLLKEQQKLNKKKKSRKIKKKMKAKPKAK